MKKKVLFAAMLSATLLGATQAVKAHPGRTDGNGCHTCRTNCEKWGLAYGEYHCHNGNSSASSSNSSSIKRNRLRIQRQIVIPRASQRSLSQKLIIKLLVKKKVMQLR